MSVVLASRAEPQRLRWMTRIAERCDAAKVELIVVRSGDLGRLGSQLRRRGVAVLSAGSADTDEALRAAGLAAAAGDVVVMIDDANEPSEEWIAALIGRSASWTASRDRLGPNR